MKRIGIMGVCLVAALATGAVAATSASAEELPALFECGKAAPKHTGHYTNRECTEASKVETGGRYEVREGVGKGKGFKGKGGPAFLEIVGLGAITCSKSSSTGKFTSPKTAGGVIVTFTGCELLKVMCSNTGKTGEIKTNALTGELGYISKEKHEVGIDFTPETGEYEVENLKCSTLTVTVHGSVIGLVNPINKFSKTFVVQFRQSAGKQDIQNLEGMPKDTLLTEFPSDPESWGPFESGISAELTWKGELLELKA